MRWMKEYGGVVALMLVLAAGIFVVGAFFGSRRTLDILNARAKQAQQQRAAVQAQAAASAVPGPKPGTVRRVSGDRLVSETPVGESAAAGQSQQ